MVIARVAAGRRDHEEVKRDTLTRACGFHRVALFAYLDDSILVADPCVAEEAVEVLRGELF